MARAIGTKKARYRYTIHKAVGTATIMTHQFDRFTLFLQASHCTDARDVQHNGVAPPLFLRDSYAQKKRLALTPPRVYAAPSPSDISIYLEQLCHQRVLQHLALVHKHFKFTADAPTLPANCSALTVNSLQDGVCQAVPRT